MCSQALRDCVLVSQDGTEFVAHRSRLKRAWPLAEKLMAMTSQYPMIRFELDEEAEIIELIVAYVNNDDYEAILEKWELSEKLLKACAEMQFIELRGKLLLTLTERAGNSSALKVWKLLRVADHPNQEKMFDTVLHGLRAMKSNREFVELNYEDLFMLLGDRRLNLYEEEEGFELIKAWIKAKPSEDRMRHLADLFALLRFDSALEAANFIARERFLSDNGISLKNVGHSLPREPRNFLVALNGWSAGAIADVEVYSNRTKRFVRMEKLENAGKDHSKVAYATAQVLDGKIYLVGGGDSTMYSKMRVFDPVTMKWKQCADMRQARCYATSAVLDGRLYVIGGFDGRRRQESVECYDPKKNLWKLAARMTDRRSDAAAVPMNDHIYVFGGISLTEVLDSVERYNPITNTWEFVATMPSKLSGHMAIAHPGLEGGILLIGGNEDGTRVKTVHHFTTYHTFRSFPSLNVSRSNAAVSCYNGKIYVAGGYNEETKGPVSSVEVFEGGAWRELCQLTRPKSGLQMVTIDNWPKPSKSLYHVPHTSAINKL